MKWATPGLRQRLPPGFWPDSALAVLPFRCARIPPGAVLACGAESYITDGEVTRVAPYIVSNRFGSEGSVDLRVDSRTLGSRYGA